MKVVILAGGNGIKLWPLSREDFPKQFNKLESLGGESLFQKSLKRALYLVDQNNIFIVVNQTNFFHAEIQAEEIGVHIKKENFIFQPLVKNTLPIISLAVEKISQNISNEKCGTKNILFLPSDQIIEGLDSFKERIELGLNNTDKGIILFGTRAKKAKTNFGYIKKENSEKIFSKISKFYEKPNKDNAQKYVEKGYLWNAGIFLFNITTFRKELEEKKPEFNSIIFNQELSDLEKFEKIENIGIDKGLIEGNKNTYCISLDNYWTDLGTFDSIGNYSDKKQINSNNIICEGTSKNNFVLTETKTKEVCLVDVEDLIIVDSEDVLLISKKGSTQKVQQIIKNTKKIIGNTGYRPWGYYKIINEGIGFKTKRLYVLPGKKMSLQSHNHRSEHWVVAEGTAKIHLGKGQSQEVGTTLVPKGESIFVAIGQLHRIENPGLVPLVIIETQIGDYLGEDDIQRYEDDFGRI